MTNRLVAAAKAAIGPVVANATTGRAIARMFNNRIPHRGLTIDTSSPLVTPEIKAALFVRGYESGEYRFVRDYLPIDQDVLELGGSLGVISCTIRRKIARDRKHVIVEADPRLADALQRNLQINQCGHNVTIEQVAIAYSGAPTIAFEYGISSVSGRLASASSQSIFEVKVSTLRDLIAKHDLVDFSLVCDIEGVEWQILSDDEAALAKAKTIIIETHDRDGFGTAEAFAERLMATGRFSRLAQHGPVLALQRVASPLDRD